MNPHAGNSSRHREPARSSRARKAGDLLRGMSALDSAGDHPIAESARQRIRDLATSMGMRVVSFTITEEPLPDPAVDALPERDFERIRAISQDMYSQPAVHVDELRVLAAKHPKVPMLRNHLAGALSAAGRHEEADRVIAHTVADFPRYLFAFCNRVMTLLSDGRIDAARALVETGPRGPLLVLTDFDPGRDVFHISEVVAHSAMVGHYMLATGRPDAARVQLKSLRQLAAGSPQTKSLRAAIKRYEAAIKLAEALRSLTEPTARAPRQRKPGPARRAPHLGPDS
ncbi:MAG: hypothetical protein IT436_00015 [Phycisphaerales bacterium]|nr:hypothetical protein [Phycisphaerales bacterium]